MPDPIGYADGMGLYEYVSSRPIAARDSTGLRWGDEMDNYRRPDGSWREEEVYSSSVNGSSDIVEAGRTIVTVLATLSPLSLGGCSKPAPAAPGVGNFIIRLSLGMPVRDPQQATAVGTTLDGYEVEFQPPKNACPGGTIQVVQVLKVPGYVARFDPQQVPAKGQWPLGYVQAGGLRGTHGQYSFRDAPTYGTGRDKHVFHLNICAVCDVGPKRTILNCVNFRFLNDTREVVPEGTWTGKGGQDGWRSSGDPPGKYWKMAEERWKVDAGL